jgi:adenylate cyclase
LNTELLKNTLALALVFSMLANAFGFFHLTAVEVVQQFVEDSRARSMKVDHPHPEIVILDVDERSLERLGQWPWSRDTIATLIEKLFNPSTVGLSALGLDFLLTESDSRPNADLHLAKALQEHPVVLSWALSGHKNAYQKGVLPLSVLTKDDLKDIDLPELQYYGYTASLDLFDRSAPSGLINGLFDTDGKLRRVALLSVYEGEVYESLALAAWRATLPVHTLTLGPIVHADGVYKRIEYIEINFVDPSKERIRIPLDAQWGTHIRWRGPGYENGGGFRYISLADVWDGKINAQDLQGKVAFWGSTAVGLMDLRTTPVNPSFPGVEIHALSYAGLSDQTFLVTPSYATGWEVLSLCLLAAVWMWGLNKLTPSRSLVMFFLCLFSLWGVSEWAYLVRSWMLPVASQAILVVGLFLIYTVWGYLAESHRKRKFVELFGQYVPQKLVEEMAKNPEKYSMAPRQEVLTILFSDVRGFTSISETLEPEVLREYINQYLTRMSACIALYGGTLDKFMGDAVMAFWGAPVPQENHAELALLAAQDMLIAAAELNKEFQTREWPALQIGVGLNTGSVRVGDMGSQQRRAYTVIGDAVNLASRLEGLTKRYGTGILVGEETVSQMPDHMWLCVDQVRVKGKQQLSRIFTILNSDSTSQLVDLCHEVQERWSQIQHAYQTQQWNRTADLLAELVVVAKPITQIKWDVLCGLYSNRINDLRSHPDVSLPKDWFHHDAS